MATVLVEPVAEHVTALRLNRPERLNAIDFTLVGDLHDALDTVAADDDCKVVILSGAGRAFCAGLDLKDWGDIPAPGSHRHFAAGQNGQSYLSNLMQHLRATPQIVLAAVNGPAFGGGLALALGCDLRIAASSASFCSAFIRTGLTGTDAGVSYLLPRLIGAARAFDMIVTGRTVDADEAERFGIVSRILPDGRLWDEAVADRHVDRSLHDVRAPEHQGGHVAQPRHQQHGCRDRTRESQPRPRQQTSRGRRLHARVRGAAQEGWAR